MSKQKKYVFDSDRVRTHHDGPLNREQIYLAKPYVWLCSAGSASEARRVVKLVKELIRLPQGAQIVSHLYNIVKVIDKSA